MSLGARSVAVPKDGRPGVPPHGPRYCKSVARQERVLTMAARIGAVVSGFFGLASTFVGNGGMWIGIVSLFGAAVYLALPLLYRFGALVAPVVFVVVAYLLLSVVTLRVGTGTGLQFYFLVAASIIVLVLGIDHMVLASALAAVGVCLTIALELLVPDYTGVQPAWAYTIGFALSVVSAWVMMVATVWFALTEVTRAEKTIEAEYDRSEALLTNILPARIAQRLKDASGSVIADKFDDASVLFADIAGFTHRSGDTSPTELVRFLDRLFTQLDALVDRHDLEKIKTSGDSYMVVSGVPEPRTDHLEALALLALEMAATVADLTDGRGRAVPLRIGFAAGPMVAGVVGARKFFYDVWGDAVNVAARMEATGEAGRIQVPQDVCERLKHAFVLEERGAIEIKGKGVMHTWYLVGRRPETADVEPIR